MAAPRKVNRWDPSTWPVVAFNYVDQDEWIEIVERSAKLLGKHDGFSCQLLTCSQGEDFFFEVQRFSEGQRH